MSCFTSPGSYSSVVSAAVLPAMNRCTRPSPSVPRRRALISDVRLTISVLPSVETSMIKRCMGDLPIATAGFRLRIVGREETGRESGRLRLSGSKGPAGLIREAASGAKRANAFILIAFLITFGPSTSQGQTKHYESQLRVECDPLLQSAVKRDYGWGWDPELRGTNPKRPTSRPVSMEPVGTPAA